MHEIEVLRKAISKAIANGFDLKRYDHVVPGRYEANMLLNEGTQVVSDGLILREDNVQLSHIYALIFSHEFAKAFFGEEMAFIKTGVTFQEYYPRAQFNNMSDQTIRSDWEYFKKIGDVQPIYKYHLQQMVIREEPIKYLEEFMEGK